MRWVSLAVALSICSAASADHPFDPRRYAFELFSEDEAALSKYAGQLDEKVVLTMLEEAWAELDSAAARADGLPPSEAKEKIRAAIRGEGGIAETFDRRLSQAVRTTPGPPTAADRLKKAVRSPVFWIIPVMFGLALIWVNRRRG